MPIFARLKSRPDTALFYGFLALLVWLPLPLGSNRTWAWSLMEAWVFLLAAGWLWLLLKKKVALPSYWRQTRWLLFCLLGFAGVIAIQLLPLPLSLIEAVNPVKASYWAGHNWGTLSLDPQVSLVHLLMTLSFLCLAMLVLVLVRDKKRLKILLGTIVLAGLIQAIYGSIMTLSGVEYGFFFKKQGFIGHATGTFWNRNNYANYLTLCLAAGTALLLASLYDKSSLNWREASRRLLQTLLGNKARLRISLAIMVIAIVLSTSRMGNTAFFISLFGTAALWLFFTKRITRGSIILLVSLLVVDILIVSAWFGLERVKERLATSSYTKETRPEVYRDTAVMIAEHWMIGTGAGSNYGVYPQYRSHDVNAFYDHTHNDYLELLAEHGVLGFSALLGLVLGAFYQAIQTMRKRKNILFQATAFAPVMAIGALAMHSTVDFNLQIPANAATFVVLLSLAWVGRFMPSRSQHA